MQQLVQFLGALRRLTYLLCLCLVGCVGQNAHPSMERSADLRRQLGIYYLQEKQWVLAEHNFNCAVHHKPQYVQAWLGLAACAEGQQDFEIAEQRYQRALDLAVGVPDRIEAVYCYGVFLARRGRYLELEKHFLTVPNRFKNISSVHLSRAFGLSLLQLLSTELPYQPQLGSQAGFTVGSGRRWEMAWQALNAYFSRDHIQPHASEETLKTALKEALQDRSQSAVSDQFKGL